MNNIEILEDFIKEKIEPDKLENYKGGYKMGFFYTKDLQKAIENLIQENKELRIQISARETVVDKLTKENKELKNKCNELNFKYTAQWVDDNFIPKSKVKEKIEVIQKRMKKETRIDFLITLKILENELQELLEEGE